MQTKKQPAQSTTVDMSEVDAYITYLRNHGRKEITLEHYRQNLGRMLRILDADGRPTRVDEIGPEDIAWLAGALQCKDRCKRDYCKQLNAMCNQLAGRDVYAQADLLWNRDTPHSLRRLYATVLHNQIGADYNTIKRLMRHSDISTTLKCYIQADETKERQARDELACILTSAMATA